NSWRFLLITGRELARIKTLHSFRENKRPHQLTPTCNCTIPRGTKPTREFPLTLRGTGEVIMKPKLWFVACSALAFVLLAGFEPAPKLAAKTFPAIINLPDGWLPEGVVVGRGHVIYAGSRRHGAIYAADLRTGQGFVAVPPQ